MDEVIALNRWIHILAGFIGLAAWWVPVATTKGGPVHRRAGKAFAVTAYLVGTTAIASAVLRIGGSAFSGTLGDNPVALAFLVFLAYIGVIVIESTYYGVRVLRTRRNHEMLGDRFLGLLLWSMAVGSLVVAAFAIGAWTPVSVILLILSPIGVKAAWDQRRYIRSAPTHSRAWFFEHMEAMLGAGVAFHTAFLVFGSQRWVDLSLLGPFNWVPWVLPALVGTVAGGYWKRRYQRLVGTGSSAPARPRATAAGA
ncbi:MAG: hypothetical protein OEO23_10870 [Gemmatimonadota bacterium]|nr:hypothetical protein [Gemmatimonadota bacterium]